MAKSLDVQVSPSLFRNLQPYYIHPTVKDSQFGSLTMAIAVCIRLYDEDPISNDTVIG